MTPRFDTLDAATWARLSPLLDEALDLPPLERAPWLAALQVGAPEDAAALQALLERHEAASRDSFLTGSVHARAAVPAVGHRLGPWTIEAPLGEGGMASVWLARRSDGRHDGQAAIKLMHGRLHSAQATQRFEREGRILARLEHPHIARLLDAGVASDGGGGQPYLVLELVRGEPIDRWCDERQLEVESRLRLFVDVAQAVAAALAQLVVHRDLKPGNVLVDGQGQFNRRVGTGRAVVPIAHRPPPQRSAVDQRSQGLVALGGAARHEAAQPAGQPGRRRSRAGHRTWPAAAAPGQAAAG